MNCGMTIRELMLFNLMMDLLVSAMARCAWRRSSSVEGADVVVFSGTEVRLVDGGEWSDMTLSSASDGGWDGLCEGGIGSISSSISIVWERDGLGVVTGVVVGSGTNMGGMVILGVRNGVEGVDAISVKMSPSSARTLGGRIVSQSIDVWEEVVLFPLGTDKC